MKTKAPVIDFKVNSSDNLEPKRMILSSEDKLLRSKSLKSSCSHLMPNDLIQKSKLDAKYFCGFATLYESKLKIRETWSPLISR